MEPPRAINETLVTLREYLERVIEERDARYLERATRQETSINDKLLALEKATNVAFVGSEKAIVKAEEAQRAYNERSNEFRGQLDDQAKQLMPRNETFTLFEARDKEIGLLRSDIVLLRQQVAQSVGRDSGVSIAQAQGQWRTSALIAGLGVLAGFGSLFIALGVVLLKG